MPAHSTLNTAADQHKPFVEATSAPGSPTTGLYWLDTTALPYILKRYNGSSWDVIIYGGATVKDDGSSQSTVVTGFDFVGPTVKATVSSGLATVKVQPVPSAALTDYTSAQYIDPWVHGVISGTVSTGYQLNTNWMYAVPIMPNQDCTVDGLGLAISGAAASGKKAKMGLYLPLSNGKPGALVAQAAAEVATDTTGVVYGAFSSNVNLTGGQMYYVALQGDGQPQVYYITPVMTPLPYVLNSGAARATYYRGGTYTGTLSDPWGTPADTEASVPRFGVRLV